MSDNDSAPSSSESNQSEKGGGGTSFGEIDHTNFLSDNMGVLFGNPNLSDVTFMVNGELFPAHKAILVARSEYFRAMFFGGMKECEEAEVVLKENNGHAFRTLLRYIYTAKLSLSELEENQVLDFLGIANKYGFSKLQNSIADYLKEIANVKNVCAILSTSQAYSIDDLVEHCLHVADRNASEVLTTQGFLQLPITEVTQLVSRDSFFAPEINIFRAIQNWVQAHPEMKASAVELLMKHVHLSQISRRDLLKIVWPSGLLALDVVLGAIEAQDDAELMLIRKSTEELEKQGNVEEGQKEENGGDAGERHEEDGGERNGEGN
uniref:BTB domain-containing protein n=1 Tax=Haemonchus contortus TaxID=6289 RepID=A0A7I5EC83_HAECO|nr:BTB:POZ and BTB Kelch-associated domain containing protein [Haemonchus contortus]